jgi:hypothetical protein
MANQESKTGNLSGDRNGANGVPHGESGDRLDEFELSSEIQGKNKLHGDDQNNRVNQRQAQPEARPDTDGLLESFEKMDKDVRAERDLGKGNRSSQS